jgi:hypothetical protein
MKRILKLDRLRLRGLRGAKDKVHLPATALGAGCLSAVAGSLDVGADASLPQLPRGESGASKIYR